MNVLIPCSHCDRYVRSQEERCPFCKGALVAASPRPVARALVRSPSRAAAFALRTALVVTPAALACGDDGTIERNPEGMASNGGTGGSSAASGTGVTDTSAGAGGAIAREESGEADAGTSDAGFVPVPIYGGVFPDPMTRARV